MLTILTILMALSLLAAIVVVLHRYQTRGLLESAERGAPLPPLNDFPTLHTTNSDSTASEMTPEVPFAQASQATAEPSEPQSWQDEVNHLKQMGDVLGALAVCKEEFPLWSAYNQACILLRSELKSADLSATEIQERLKTLYRTAATAELIHDKSSAGGKLALSALRQLQPDQAESLDMPYAELGYAHLRLIRKGDIKLMQEYWGRPRNHLKPRQLHQDWWDTVTRRLQ